MPMTWALHDLDDNRIGGIPDRLPGGNVTVERNGQRRAELSISLQDPLAVEVIPAARVLRCWLDGVPVFAGHLLQPTFSGTDQTVAIKAIDPSQRLAEAFVGQSNQTGVIRSLPNATTDLPLSYRATAQGDIMWLLVEAASPLLGVDADGIPGHGIVRGSIGSTPTRDVDYILGKPIWEALTEWAAAWGDFVLRPLNPDGSGALVALDVMARQGVDRSQEVRFEYATGKRSATSFQWEPDDNIVNRCTVVGQVAGEVADPNAPPAYPPFAVSEDTASQQVYGIKADWQTIDTDSMSTLQGIADAVVGSRAFPVDHFDFTPDVETAGLPRFAPDGDFWVGDTIGLVARLAPGIFRELAGRVDVGKLTEMDAAGTVQAELTCAPQDVDG